MRSWHSRVALALVLVALALAPAAAQTDLARVLVGKWEGEVQMAGGTYPRTLIIRSVEQRGRMSMVDAAYGGKGGDYGGAGTGIEPVDLMLETVRDDVIVRFRTVENWAVKLTLYKDGKHLLGAMFIPMSRGGAQGINPVKLEKVE